jgi:hypothetical protein
MRARIISTAEYPSNVRNYVGRPVVIQVDRRSDLGALRDRHGDRGLAPAVAYDAFKISPLGSRLRGAARKSAVLHLDLLAADRIPLGIRHRNLNGAAPRSRRCGCGGGRASAERRDLNAGYGTDGGRTTAVLWTACRANIRARSAARTSATPRASCCAGRTSGGGLTGGCC